MFVLRSMLNELVVLLLTCLGMFRNPLVLLCPGVHMSLTTSVFGLVR